MGPGRDVDLKAWLDGFAFHPANSKTKQLGHNILRQLVANLAGLLHAMIPPSREKSLVFTHLELVLMYANKALAVSGGPRPVVSADEAEELDYLTQMNDALMQEGAALGTVLSQDPRIKEYEASQRAAGGEQVETGPLAGLPFPVPGVVHEQAGQGSPTVDKVNPAEVDQG